LLLAFGLGSSAPLVRHCLYDLKLKRVEAAVELLEEILQAAQAAAAEAVKSKMRAMAPIVATGARQAAMAGAFVALSWR
jgi:hypothetical protein